jgi:hypothetical protein
VKLEPPAAFYTALGRVVAAAAALEAMLADVAAAAENTPLGDIGSTWERAGSPAAAASSALKAATHVPDSTLADEVRFVVEHAKHLLHERNRYVHSVLLLDLEMAPDEWRRIHPRTGNESSLDVEGMDALTQAIHAAIAQSGRLAARLADFWRTTEGPT